MIDYFFTIIDLGTESFFTQHKDSFLLIRYFGPMYSDFDEYPCFSGRNNEMFEKNVNENIQCVHGYDYSSGKHKCAHGLMRTVGGR